MAVRRPAAAAGAPDDAGFRTVIGVDCATKPERTGLAYARRDPDAWRVRDVRDGARESDPAEIIASWLQQAGPALIALDAPLGWPAPLASALAGHRPGEPVSVSPAHLFARETDRHVHAVYGKKPLDVGADRIARTAVAALGLLAEVRRRTGLACPLWWRAGDVLEPAAVEVYPAGTLRAYGVPAKGYKTSATGPGRREVASLLEGCLRLPDGFDASAWSDDAIDALLCVVAGIDVVEDRAIPPSAEQRDAARTEGWIWVRRSKASAPTGTQKEAPS